MVAGILIVLGVILLVIAGQNGYDWATRRNLEAHRHDHWRRDT